MKIRNETKIGILAAAAIALGIFGFKYLQGINVLKTSKTFYVRYDNVDQLRASSAVLINGLEIGMVKTLTIDPADGRSIIAEINIERGIDIPKDAIATIVGQGIMGGKAISLENTHPCGDDCAESGDWLQGNSKTFLESLLGKPEELDAYSEHLIKALGTAYDTLTDPRNPKGFGRTLLALEYSLKNIEVLTAKVSRMIDASTANINATTANAAKITRTLANNSANIDAILSDLTAVSAQLKNAGLDETSRKAGVALDSVTASLQDLRRTLGTTGQALTKVDSIAGRLYAGQGTAGKLLTDEELYLNLTRLSRQLQLITQDLRLNPKRYTTLKVKLFGKNKVSPYEVPTYDPAYQMLIDSLEIQHSLQAKAAAEKELLKN